MRRSRPLDRFASVSRRRSASLAAGVAVASLAGCSLVGKDLDGYFASTGGTDSAGGTGGLAGSGASGGSAGSGAGGTGATAGGGNGGTAGSAGAAGCNSLTPPERPTIADSSGGPDPKIFILRDIVIDQAPTLWESIGYDLDGLCSYPPDYQVECVAEGAGEPEIDGNGGIDNAFGHTVIPILKVTDVTLQESAQRNQREGQSAIVVHITGWNGEADDPSVQVWLAETAHGIPAGATEPGMPNWDGQDSFYVPDAAFKNGQISQPEIGNDNAYIAGRVLVMRIPDRSSFPFQTSDGSVFLRLTDATLTGAISEDGTMLDNVILAGRWAAQDVLEALEYIGICPGQVEYGLVQNLLRNSSDIRSTPGTGGPGATCDAVSIGIGLTGYPGNFGGLVPTTPSSNPCDGTGGAGGGGATGGAAGSAG